MHGFLGTVIGDQKKSLALDDGTINHEVSYPPIPPPCSTGKAQLLTFFLTFACRRLNHMHLHDAQRALQRFAQTGARYLLTNVRETRVGVGCGFLGFEVICCWKSGQPTRPLPDSQPPSQKVTPQNRGVLQIGFILAILLGVSKNTKESFGPPPPATPPQCRRFKYIY